MKRRHYEITQTPKFKGFNLYSNRSKTDKGYYVEILEGLFKGIEELFTHSSRINVLRFDLGFKSNDQFIRITDNENELVSRFFTRLKRNLKAWKYEDGKRKGENRGIKDIFHVFVRENSSQKKVHFHCAIAFKSIALFSTPISRKNAQGESQYCWIYKLIDDAWRQTCSEGHVNFGSKWEGKQRNHFYHVQRSDISAQQNLMQGLSYLSKVKTKEVLPKHTRLYTFSRSIGRGRTDFKLIKERPEEAA